MILADVCEKITDGSHNPPAGIALSRYRMLSSKNINDDSISYEEPRYLSESEFQAEHQRTQIARDDVLVTIVGTIGRAAVVNEEQPNLCMQRSVAVLKPKHGIVDSRFLMYELMSLRYLLESKAHGAAQRGIYLKELSRIPVKVPPMDRQLQIVDVLDTIQKGVKNRERVLALLDELVKARFVEMFGDPVLNTKQWEKHSLSRDIVFLTSGSRGWSSYFANDGEIFVTIKNVKHGHITLDDVQYVHAPDNAEAKRTRLQAGDLLVSITADLGRTGVVSEELAARGAYINQHLTCIRLKQNIVNPMYVAMFMESDGGKRQFEAKNQTGVKAGLNFDAIKSLEVLVPPLPLQQKFAAFVHRVDETKAAVRAQGAALGMLRAKMMQEYFG